MKLLKPNYRHLSIACVLKGLILVNLCHIEGCATHYPVKQKVDGTYHVRTDATIVSNLDDVQADNLEEARAFAKNRGKEIKIVRDEVIPNGDPMASAGHTLVFQLSDPDVEYKKELACEAKLKKNKELDILRGKLSLTGAKEQTFSMLANTHKPTDEEKKGLEAYGDLRKVCFDEGERAALIAETPRAIMDLNASSFSAGDAILVALHNGRLTYGEYARFRKKLEDARIRAFSDIEKELKKNDPGSAERAIQMMLQVEKKLESIVIEANRDASSEKKRGLDDLMPSDDL